ncbi:MAG: SRPBCC family protein [Aquificae bacterium]|nr:SRPBCC family protein [Aquificota bacterium]
MKFNIEEKFSVNADYDAVFEFFTKPENMFPCIPGAELISTKEDGSFEGKVKAKVGPTTLTYKGIMQYEEIDKAKGYMKLSGKGKDVTGGGLAKAIIESWIKENDGKIDVIVKVEADITGRVIQFGRGMIEQIAKQMFRDFSACAKQILENKKKASSPVEENNKENYPTQKELNVISLVFRTFVSMISQFFKKFRKKG